MIKSKPTNILSSPVHLTPPSPLLIFPAMWNQCQLYLNTPTLCTSWNKPLHSLPLYPTHSSGLRLELSWPQSPTVMSQVMLRITEFGGCPEFPETWDPCCHSHYCPSLLPKSFKENKTRKSFSGVVAYCCAELNNVRISLTWAGGRTDLGREHLPFFGCSASEHPFYLEETRAQHNGGIFSVAAELAKIT